MLLPFLRGHFTGGGAAAVAVVLYGNCDYDDALKELCEVLSGNGFCPAAAAAMVGEHAFAPALAHGRPDAEDIAAAEAFAGEFDCVTWVPVSRIRCGNGNGPFRQRCPAGSRLGPTTPRWDWMGNQRAF